MMTATIEERHGQSVRATALVLSTVQDVEDLIADLRSALKRSKRSGGKYAVYRKGTAGGTELAIEIQVDPAAAKATARTAEDDPNGMPGA